MKLLFGFLLIGLTLNGALTLPARNNPQDDAEVISLPRERNVESPSADPDFNEFKGVIDTGSGYPFLQPNPSPFNLGFFDSFEDIFRRLRSRLWPVISDDFDKANGKGGVIGNAGDDSSDDFGSGFSFGLRPLTPLNPKNGNTTSTVKVVDGHKLEINETVYGDANNVFKVRVVNVRPLASGEDVVEGVTNNQDEAKPLVPYSPSTSAPVSRGEFDDEEDENDRREPLEKQPKDNEIRDIDALQSATTTTTATTKIAIDSIAESTDIRQNIMANMNEHQERNEEDESHLAQDATTMQYNEETEELDDSHNHNEPQEQQDEHQHQEEDESLTAIENFDDEDDNADEEPEQAALQYKERENFESSDDEDDEERQTPPTMSATFNDEWSSLDQDQAEDAGNDLDNNIDIYENFVPIDLSNDIAVNDAAAADPEFPVNPDAEFIEVPTKVHAMLPKFEKLSMGPMPPTEMK